MREIELDAVSACAVAVVVSDEEKMLLASEVLHPLTMLHRLATLLALEVLHPLASPYHATPPCHATPPHQVLTWRLMVAPIRATTGINTKVTP